ncbi:MAG: hypothetical protein IM547_12435, partial [Chitinophagaceae bacterium]|nr:hypothetical protein [Chitinophagaceae bacterium]
TVTPFAAQPDQRERFALSEFNQVVKNTASSMGINYLDITPSTLQAVKDPEGLCSDGLHYSGKTYGVWAGLMEKGWLSVAGL